MLRRSFVNQNFKKDVKTSNPFFGRQQPSLSTTSGGHESKRILKQKTVGLVVLFLMLILLHIHLSNRIIANTNKRKTTTVKVYQCPSKSSSGSERRAANDNQLKSMEEFYNQTNGDTISAVAAQKQHNNNKLSSKHKLETTIYDGWDVDFLGNKEIYKDWKRVYFSSLQNGDAIYESACGEGFNLAMTLQILEEHHNVTNIHVYGNDYIANSVHVVAPHVLKELAPRDTQIGSLCQGDSSNLYYVPSNTFDLAFTGYIEAIYDPLNIYNKTMSEDVNYDDIALSDLCDTKNESSDNWAKAKLMEIDQAKQEDWYAKWVTELIRIVKPGKPIIIENVGLPICQDFQDYGGVAKSWWKLAVSKYKWDVDVESIILKDVLVPNNNTDDDDFIEGEESRYNVFMRRMN